ncbi:hypothetical protein FHL15_008304 [Xylaria flabelliformis]|uniref:Uncharacterized protein n=1 Tax=Xylaria flabelliformis TaxID=2512241 RepID=A0A553HS01_9PEZI|nr:hypothetical protein FHL15_008304 [Xylaria flabelliformis]
MDGLKRSNLPTIVESAWKSCKPCIHVLLLAPVAAWYGTLANDAKRRQGLRQIRKPETKALCFTADHRIPAAEKLTKRGSPLLSLVVSPASASAIAQNQVSFALPPQR